MSPFKRTQTGVYLLAIALTLSAAGCSFSATTDSADGTNDVSPGVGSQLSDSVAYDYFGSVEIAQGSTVDSTISNVESSADMNIDSTPEGVTARIYDADDGSTRIEIVVSNDAPTGSEPLTFDIEGESEPVNWSVLILER